MKPLEIKGARTRLGYTQQDLANELKLSVVSYWKKENGLVKFTCEEIAVVAKLLKLNVMQVNDFFFDGELPTG